MAQKNKKLRGLAASNLKRFERLLQSVALLMLREGTTEAQIETSMRRSLLAATKSPFDTPTLMHLYVDLSDLLHAWHEDPTYIDGKANPLALPLLGRGRSLESLMKKIGSRLTPASVLSSLKIQRLVRKLPNGKFVPTKAVAHLRGDGPEMSGYLGRSILHLIETNDANRRISHKRRPLLDRAAIVADLPLRDAEDFKKFSAEQGANVTANASAWLESRRSRGALQKGKRRTVTAGLHVFAFVAPSRK